MKRVAGLILVFVLCPAIILTGCAGQDTRPIPSQSSDSNTSINPSPTSRNGKTTKQAADLMAGIQAAARSETPNAPDPQVLKAINRFSAELFQAAAVKPGNVMISPASVYLALAMTLNGADGDTKAAMISVLAEQGITLDMVNQASRDWQTWLARTGEKTTLTIANSIWFDQEFVPYRPFLQANADYFAADARRLDFKDPGTPDIINAWVKTATKGTIEKIIESIRSDVVMYLINAIYFKSDWEMPFDKNDTYDQTFTAPEGAIQTSFLHRNGSMAYFETLESTGISLPYDDGQFAFFALLPDGQVSPRDWLASQTLATLFSGIAGMMGESEISVDLALPKFESSYEDSLVGELKGLGMDIAFDPGLADFSQMNESHEKNLYIGEVKHKTFVRVDEKGTEAAAVTSVEMRVTSLPVSDKQVVFDRPFLYGIMDMKTGVPLFVGIMENPAS